MNCAEAYVKYMCKWLLEKRYDDMELMAKNFDKGCIDRLKLVASTPFGRLTYTEAIKILEEAVAKGKKFDNDVEWGIDLASEHERFFFFLLLTGNTCKNKVTNVVVSPPILQILDRGCVSEASYCVQLPERNQSFLHET